MGDVFAETDLYQPIKEFLIKQGYEVRSEVNGCDLAAVREEKILLVEMKKTFSLKLVYQALDRQALAEEVFVAIPRPIKGQNTKQWKSMLKLLKRLELGLLTVAMDSPLKSVDVILEPRDSIAWKNKKKLKALKQEIEGRAFDGNTGGMNRRKIMTAYREKALELLCILQVYDCVSYRQLRELGLDEKQIRILGSNVYGWFVRKERGIYTLSKEGRAALTQADCQELIQYYQSKWTVQ